MNIYNIFIFWNLVDSCLEGCEDCDSIECTECYEFRDIDLNQ